MRQGILELLFKTEKKKFEHICMSVHVCVIWMSHWFNGSLAGKGSIFRVKPNIFLYLNLHSTDPKLRRCHVCGEIGKDIGKCLWIDFVVGLSDVWTHVLASSNCLCICHSSWRFESFHANALRGMPAVRAINLNGEDLLQSKKAYEPFGP